MDLPTDEYTLCDVNNTLSSELIKDQDEATIGEPIFFDYKHMVFNDNKSYYANNIYSPKENDYDIKNSLSNNTMINNQVNVEDTGYRDIKVPSVLDLGNSVKGSNLQNNETKQKKKRNRRTASEIKREWKCKFCIKSYGTEGALKTHCKIKHPESQRFYEKKLNHFVKILNTYNAEQSSSKLNRKSENTVEFYNYSDVHSNTVNIIDNNFNIYKQLNIEGIPPSHNIPYPLYTYHSTWDQNFTFNPQSYYSFEYDSNSITDVYMTENHYGDQHQLEKPDESSKKMDCLPLLLLKIGNFSKTNENGDLYSWFSYIERKFYWEILYVQSHMKMEISFDDINAINIDTRSDGTMVVAFELNNPPKFWCGHMTPQQLIQWSRIQDFTNGYASKYCQHILHFMEIVIRDPMKRLLEQEDRFKKLAEKGFKVSKSMFYKESDNEINPNNVTVI